MAKWLCVWLVLLGAAGLCFDVALVVRDPVITSKVHPPYGPSQWLLPRYLHFAVVWKWGLVSVIAGTLGLVWLGHAKPGIPRALCLGLVALGVVLVAVDVGFFLRHPEIVSRISARLHDPGPWGLPAYLRHAKTWQWGMVSMIAGVMGVVALHAAWRRST
jgi:hypothetical protein